MVVYGGRRKKLKWSWGGWVNSGLSRGFRFRLSRVGWLGWVAGTRPTPSIPGTSPATATGPADRYDRAAFCPPVLRAGYSDVDSYSLGRGERGARGEGGLKGGGSRWGLVACLRASRPRCRPPSVLGAQGGGAWGGHASCEPNGLGDWVLRRFFLSFRPRSRPPTTRQPASMQRWMAAQRLIRGGRASGPGAPSTRAAPCPSPRGPCQMG